MARCDEAEHFYRELKQQGVRVGILSMRIVLLLAHLFGSDPCRITGPYFEVQLGSRRSNPHDWSTRVWFKYRKIKILCSARRGVFFSCLYAGFAG